MKSTLWKKIGTAIFWALWPIWAIYFKLSGMRSRVVVVCGDEILLVQSWLGVKSFYLPGGGARRHESTSAAAVRELREETGISIMERSLKNIGLFTHKQYGFYYKARLFSVELGTKPELELHKHEIHDARWVNFRDLKKLKLNDETKYALERYRPAEQARLL